MQQEQATFLKYINFVAQNGRSYASKDVFDHRYTIFKQNLEIIERHNSRDVPFTLAVNQFSDQTIDEFLESHTSTMRHRKRLRGPIESGEQSNWHPDYNLDAYEWPEKDPLPESKNWYAEGKVTLPQNQGKCGACWAFATASTLESLALISGHDLSPREYSV